MNHGLGRRLPFAALAALALLAAPAVPAGAQAPALEAFATLSGEVVDAATGEPLAEAVLRLRRLPGAGSAGPDPERSAVTDAAGRYHFRRLVPGAYSLDIERLGFRPARVRVEIGRAAESRVSVGLELEPIALEPVTVAGRPAAPYDRDLSADGAAGGQAAAARLRQRRYLASDVWSLTHAELLSSVTLGESDLFRALHRLPGVGTRDEWTAELWTRGSDWDHTRVYFDGLPLFNPVHGAGVLSGVNSDAVGAVYLHPGVRPARLGEGATALELVSRPGGEAGETRGFGELALTSARLSLDGPFGGGGGWMVAGRRTYLDVLSRGVGELLDIEDAYLPYRFTDVTARVDRPVGGSAALELSALWELDRLTGDVPDVIHGSELSWGNLGVQATLESPLGPLRARHTLGFTGYHVDADTVPAGPAAGDFSAPRVGPMDHRIRYWLARGELGPPGPPAARPWTAGWEVVRQSARAEGETPPMYLEFRTTAERTLHRNDALTVAAAWYDRRWSGDRVEVDAGLRAEAGTAVANGGALRLAPRLLARVRAADGVTVTGAAGRSWQYTQSLAPVGYFRADFPSGRLWLMASGAVPALRADVASLGGEAWLGDAWLAAVTGYVRSSSGVVVPDPRPGVTLGRPLFVAVEEAGRGIELAARRLAGRLTGSLAYTLAAAEHSLGDLAFPTTADRRHAVDATALWRAGPGLRLGGAFTFATGAPYTRVVFVRNDPATDEPVGVLGRPNEGRAPSYASLDLMVDWSHRFRTWSIGGFLQVRNVLGRHNESHYTSTISACTDGSVTEAPDGLVCPDGSAPTLRDQFLFGLPTLPLFGVRVEF